jgi:hypothetical protein
LGIGIQNGPFNNQATATVSMNEMRHRNSTGQSGSEHGDARHDIAWSRTIRRPWPTLKSTDHSIIDKSPAMPYRLF